jgi:hypothetical protein
MLRSFGFAAVSAAALLFGAQAAQATVMIPLSIEDMTKESTAVVRGKVLDKSAAWDAEHKKIYTTTKIEVTEAIHATMSLPKQLEIRTMGGEVDGIGMKVAGTPSFLMGEDVVVFLRPDAKIATAYQVIGMAQGKYQIRQDSAGRVIATPSLEGIAFTKPSETGVLRVDPNAPASREIAYLDLRKQIVEIAKKAEDAAPKAVIPAQKPATPAVTE